MCHDRKCLPHVEYYIPSVLRVKYTFTEGADLPICIVLLLLSLAFADSAFEAELSRPEQIYKIVIPPPKK